MECIICVNLITKIECKMSTKKIGLVLTIILPTLLIGCGGGGGSDSSNPEPDKSVKETGLSETFVKFQLDTLKYKEVTYVNGIVPNTQYHTSLGENDYLLTQDKLYTNAWVDASTKALLPLSLYFSDAPNVGKTDSLEKIDISGKQVYDTVYPGFTQYLGFYQGNDNNFSGSLAEQLYNQSTMVFPQGSVCYRTLSTVPQKGYITFNGKEVVDTSYDTFIGNFENYFSEKLAQIGHTKQVESGTWAGYSWKYYKEYDQFGLLQGLVVVNFNGKPVIAEAHDFEKYDVNKLLIESKNRLNSIADKNSDYYQDVLLSKNLYEKGCDWYNQTAANTIRTLKNR